MFVELVDLLQIGYGVPNSPRLQELSFWPSPGGEGKDGKWSCQPDSSMPALSHSLAHPCSGGGTACCGYPTTPIITRFNSFFTSEHAVLIAAYEVWPICGDGLDIEISLSSNSEISACSLPPSPSVYTPDSSEWQE